MLAAESYALENLSNNGLIHNIKQLMYLRRLNEAELARQAGIPQPTLHRLLAGNTPDPRISTLHQLTNYFQVTLDELYTPSIGLQRESAKTQSIPVLPWHNCRKYISDIQSLSSSNWSNWLVTEPIEPKAYALMSKPSMEPHFARNTFLIISPGTKPMDGDFIVVDFKETEEATLRELIIDGPSTLLSPINSKAEAEKLDSSIQILGTLIQSRFFYRL